MFRNIPTELIAHIDSYLTPLDHLFAVCTLSGFADVPRPEPIITTSNICTMAAADGNMHALIAASDRGFPCGEELCAIAAFRGHIDMLKWLHDRGVGWDKTTITMALLGQRLDCLNYAAENGCPMSSMAGFIQSNFCNAEFIGDVIRNGPEAARTSVEWLPNHFRRGMAYLAAANRDVRPSDEYIFTTALANDDIEVVTHMIKIVPASIVRRSYFDLEDFIARNGLTEWAKSMNIKLKYYAAIARYDSVDGLAYMLSRGYDKHADHRGDIVISMLFTDAVKCLEWIHHNWGPLNYYVYQDAVKLFATRCMKYMCDIGLHSDEVLKDILRLSNINSIEWLLDNAGAKLTSDLYAHVHNHNINMVRWLHMHGCPWPDDITIMYAELGHYDQFEYAVKNGAPFDDRECVAAIIRGVAAERRGSHFGGSEQIKCLNLIFRLRPNARYNN